MAKISACIISFNEEAKIGDCIRSVQGVADEIVVVDSCSTDRTREIAQELGARVIEQPFLGYIEQKNFAVDQASHEWILALDCDERLSGPLRDAIRAGKDTLQPGTAYQMSRKTFYVNRWLDHCWYPDRKVRLFHRSQGRWGGVNPHDRVEVQGADIVTLPGDILHLSFDSISDHVQTIDRFTEIGAREAFARGKRATRLDPFIHGAATFGKQYLLKRGFLDGFPGLTACALSGVHAYVKYSKLRMLGMSDANGTGMPPR